MDIFNKKSKEVAEQATKTEKSTSSFDDAMKALSPSSLAAVAGITALIGTVKALTGAFSSAIANYAHFEKMQMGLTTFFQDADKGKAKFEELRKLSNETTFGVDELTDSFTQLANVGVNVDTIKDKLVMLGNVSQGDKEKFADLVSVYSKINAVGKASSMQLQQIAMRGVPIYDILKKIGVTGTASAEDITRAFQEMTKEGGQFYNAMNNINDTIEGKQGFISDYLKEMSVNFAEVTGLADAYKSVLDVLKNVIGAISDKLMEWNNNPFMKALLTGALVGSIAAIGTLIMTSLIPTLSKVIAKLVTMQLLQGPKGWAVLAVAGIGLAVGAYASYSKSTEKATEDTLKLAKACEEVSKQASKESYLRANGVMVQSDTRNAQLTKEQNYLEGLKEGYNSLAEKLAKAKKDYEDWGGDAGAKVLDDVRVLKEQIEGYNAQLKISNDLIEKQEKKIASLNNKIKEYDLSSLAESFEEIYSSIMPQDDKEMTSLKEQLSIVEEYKKKLEQLNGKYDNNGQLIKFDDATRKAIDDTVRYLQNKLNGVSAWEDVFKSVTGVSAKNGGAKAGSDYQARMLKEYEAQVNATKLLGGDTSKIAEDFVKKIEGHIDSLMSNIDVDKPFKETDKTIKALVATLDIFKEKIEETEEGFSSLSDLANALKEKGTVGGYAAGKGIEAIQGTAIGSAAEGAMEGASIAGPWGALIGAILGLLSSMEHWQDFLDELDELIEPLRPTLDAIINLLIGVVDALEGFAAPIEDLLGWVAGIINMLGTFFKIIGKGASLLHEIFGGILYPINKMTEGINWVVGELEEFFGLESEVNEEKSEELQRIKSLNDSYKTMIGTLEDLQKEYEKRKRSINSQGYADSVTGVHDMILTPQGQFSTDPDDYIIATKNPSGLNGGGSIEQKVIINNYTNDAVETRTDNMGNLVVQISQKVAYDYANGNNGWDNAVLARQTRNAGRNLAM